MTYPFMPDPVPPGHGEPVLELGEPPPSYVVMVVLGDGVPTVDLRTSDLDEAFAHRVKARQELRDANYRFFFVGVMDEDDPERGWLEDEN